LPAARYSTAVSRPTVDVSLSEARRTALAAQGFDRPRPSGLVSARDISRVLRQLGVVQIDYVNVLAPAHYQVLFSRLGPYRCGLLDDLLYRRRAFTEQWAHEASIIPMETWPLRHRMERYRVRPWGFEKFLDKHPDYVRWVLNEVRTRGPVTADSLRGLTGNRVALPLISRESTTSWRDGWGRCRAWCWRRCSGAGSWP
jgi:uncharacterized protein YcaQ